MKAIGNIYLTWRKGKGHRRIVVGVIRRNVTGGVRFNYIKDGVDEARKEGFSSYTDFPDTDPEKIYSENVIEIFGQRLTRSERADIQKYYDFWEINPLYKDEKYYLLAHTQGLLATDNFEFLADYNPIQGLSFMSEICGLSKYQHSSDLLEIGEELTWKLDARNQYDNNAVQVYKGNVLIGYVKKIHCRVFSKPNGSRLKIIVKSVERNGHLNRVFIKVSF